MNQQKSSNAAHQREPLSQDWRHNLLTLVQGEGAGNEHVSQLAINHLMEAECCIMSRKVGFGHLDLPVFLHIPNQGQTDA